LSNSFAATRVSGVEMSTAAVRERSRRAGALPRAKPTHTGTPTDVLRILDSATGTFYDDFSKCSQPFVHVVKQAQSKSVGTVTEAGIESETANEARCWSR
jgi:Mce-associated membrane protein